MNALFARQQKFVLLNKLTRQKKNLNQTTKTLNNWVWFFLLFSLSSSETSLCNMFTLSFYSCDVFRFKGGRVGIPPFLEGSVAMGRVAARGQALLRSPVVFQPAVPVPFPYRLCFWSAISGFGTALIIFFAWIWTL